MKTKWVLLLLVALFFVSGAGWYASIPAFTTEQPVSAWERLWLAPRAARVKRETVRCWRQYSDFWDRTGFQPYDITYYPAQACWSVELRGPDRPVDENVITIYQIKFPSILWFDKNGVQTAKPDEVLQENALSYQRSWHGPKPERYVRTVFKRHCERGYAF